MKILYVITELHEGGAENALFETARRIGEAHEVQVVCLYGGDGAVAQRLREAHIPVTDLKITKAGELLRGRRLRTVIRQWQPDIVHSWLFHANLLARLFCPKSIPLVNSLRVVEPRRSHILLDRLTRRRVDRVIGNSENVVTFARETIGFPAEKCTCIENGVDLIFWQEARHAVRPTDCLNGLTIARKVHQKGLDILLAALAQLPDDLNWHWSLIGDEPEPQTAEALRTQIKTANLQDRISWLNAQPREALREYYAQAHLFALPSRWEGQPNTVLEALASGCTVLTSAHTGFATDAPLTIVTPNTPEAWAQMLLQHQSHSGPSTVQMSSTVNSWFNHRSWDMTAEKQSHLYMKVLSARGGHA